MAMTLAARSRGAFRRCREQVREALVVGERRSRQRPRCAGVTRGCRASGWVATDVD